MTGIVTLKRIPNRRLSLKKKTTLHFHSIIAKKSEKHKRVRFIKIARINFKQCFLKLERNLLDHFFFNFKKSNSKI